MSQQTKLESIIERINKIEDSKPVKLNCSTWKTYKSILFNAKFERFDFKCSEIRHPGYTKFYWISEYFVMKPKDSIMQGPFSSKKQLKIHLDKIDLEFITITPGQEVQIIGYFYHSINDTKKIHFEFVKMELVNPILPVDQNRLDSILSEYQKQRSFYSTNPHGDKSLIPEELDDSIKIWKEAIKLVKNYGKQAKSTRK